MSNVAFIAIADRSTTTATLEAVLRIKESIGR
jgi:hypothetical protein